MKSTILTTVLLAITLAASATVWRVNNNAGVDADFTTLQAAHDAASAGDTIYLEGSTVSYGNLTATKPLVIIGAGYFLSQNEDTQANLTSSITGTIIFNNGSQGSRIAGCSIMGTITVNTSDIVIERNRIEFYTAVAQGLIGLTGNSISNILIRNNYIYNPYQFGGNVYAFRSNGSGVSNVMISNNFIMILHSGSFAIQTTSGFNGTFENNVTHGRVQIENAVFNNNIMRASVFEQINSTWQNNIGHSTQFGTDNGNQENVDMNDVFVMTGSTDGQWQLKVGSPAIGAGLGGIDCGMFGGSTPYKLSGLPAIPAVYFHDQYIDNVNEELNVSIKTKCHN